MKDLHREVAQIIQSFHGQLAELVKSFEPARLCKRRMTELASTLDAATELQAEFHELSQKFRPFEGERAR